MNVVGIQSSTANWQENAQKLEMRWIESICVA